MRGKQFLFNCLSFCSNDTAGAGNGPRPRRGRLPTEPGPNSGDYGQTSPLLSSPIKSPPYSSAGTDSDDNSVKCKSRFEHPKMQEI